jgi:Lrp/AsnC family transcriptional regulator, regulator for asnA, asnC and gidA
MKERSYIPDEKDWQIIELLRDGIISNIAIAKNLDVSEGMIRQRIKRLQEHGILSLRGLINPDLLENHHIVLLGANVNESRFLQDKALEISKLEHVLSVSIVSGRFDLIIELLLDSQTGLIEFLTEKLSTIKGITKTESFLTLKAYSKFV